MNLEEFRIYCASRPGAWEDFPFDEETLVIKVCGKMFALTNIRRRPFTVNLKCEPGLARDLRTAFPEVKPGYHMNKEHWNTILFDGNLPEEKLTWLIDHSYQLVVQGLRKRDRERLLLHRTSGSPGNQQGT